MVYLDGTDEKADRLAGSRLALQSTYFPHSFLMPLCVFLCSGETGDCWPESLPDDRGERSDSVDSSALSVFPEIGQDTQGKQTKRKKNLM